MLGFGIVFRGFFGRGDVFFFEYFDVAFICRRRGVRVFGRGSEFVRDFSLVILNFFLLFVRCRGNGG